ncbi:F-box protein At1g61340-like [Zingiber officinale]|uniref:F-box protein At1g61340-like n=1 Tax=Zingiber officinale TaxID=94328 RepID=UPI001C4BE45F|nr:F-box protein At1g61340-like [Zingiber officinale]
MAVRDTQGEESVPSSSSSSIACPNYFGSAEESIPAGVKLVHSTSSLGRKRVGLSKSVHLANLSSPCGSSSSKKLCTMSTMEQSIHLETLPQDVLVRILSKVDHGDLMQLLFVSKTVNQATTIAKEMHFALRTPISKPVFKDNVDGSEAAPNAPMQHRVARSRLHAINRSSIVVVLFPSCEDE